MGKAELNKTPILYEKNYKRYYVMNISMPRSDNSLYFTFPHNPNRRIINGALSKYSKNDEEKVIDLQEGFEENEDIKVSFHPNEMIVHVNSNSTKKKSNDYKVFNSIPYKDKYIIHLLQVIIPNNEEIFNIYNKNKYQNTITILNSCTNKTGISFEFIVHSSDIKITPMHFLSKDIVFYKTFDSLSKTTYSVGVSGINNNSNSILLSINTKDDAVYYTIK